MRIIAVAVLSSTLLLTVPAAARNNAQASAERPETGKADAAGKKICKRLETSGTRMAERVCLTKEEWKKVEELD